VKQREALGAESFLYTFMRIAACDKIQQWGFDETTLDGHEILNQWAMLVDVCTGDERIETGFTVVTLECAGILPCSEAQSVVNHIEDVRAQGIAEIVMKLSLLRS
jgi:hypothetical protein